MKIGITYDLKGDAPAGADVPDDFQEEFDSPATIEAHRRGPARGGARRRSSWATAPR